MLGMALLSLLAEITPLKLPSTKGNANAWRVCIYRRGGCTYTSLLQTLEQKVFRHAKELRGKRATSDCLDDAEIVNNAPRDLIGMSLACL